jgi:hypothetical protein
VKLRIDGREYDGSAQPFLGDLMQLKRRCGYGYGTVIDRMAGLDADANIKALLDDESFVEALIAWMWMSRLRAGERSLTFDEAGMVALDQIEFVRERGDKAAAADAVPTSAPKDSAGAESKPAARPRVKSTASTSRTSRRPSTSG